jgi:hypothetical protein
MQHPVARHKIAAVFTDRQNLIASCIADKIVFLVVAINNGKKNVGRLGSFVIARPYPGCRMMQMQPQKSVPVKQRFIIVYSHKKPVKKLKNTLIGYNITDLQQKVNCLTKNFTSRNSPAINKNYCICIF